MKQSVEQRSDVRCDREKSDEGSLVVYKYFGEGDIRWRNSAVGETVMGKKRHIHFLPLLVEKVRGGPGQSRTSEFILRSTPLTFFRYA